MTQSLREMLHSDALRSAPPRTRLHRQNRKNTATARQKTCRHGGVKSVSPETQVGPVWRTKVPSCSHVVTTLGQVLWESSGLPQYATMA